ncbi:MAG TPA: hypothetical protein VNA19_10090 [Pyrinomonadaceae bacterium]|jgi:hypothetical protein|nr:hypothetical protein [Pyrinomonadaceae bacterium]
MEAQAKLNIKRAWVIFYASAFLCYRLGQTGMWSESVVLGPYWLLEPLMFFASFPASVFYALGARAFLCTECYGLHGLEREPWFWAGMLIAGYLQWFKLVPLFFARPKLTALDLSAETTRQQQQPDVAATPAHPHTASASHTPQLSPPTDTRPPIFSHFDDRGQTPLGRCLLNYSQD